MVSPRGKWRRINHSWWISKFRSILKNLSLPKLVFPFLPRFSAFSSSNYGHNKQSQSIKRVARPSEPGSFSDRSDHTGIKWSLRSPGSLVTFCGDRSDRSDHMGTRLKRERQSPSSSCPILELFFSNTLSRRITTFLLERSVDGFFYGTQSISQMSYIRLPRRRLAISRNCL